jgi:hypothetical protein
MAFAKGLVAESQVAVFWAKALEHQQEQKATAEAASLPA